MFLNHTTTAFTKFHGIYISALSAHDFKLRLSYRLIPAKVGLLEFHRLVDRKRQNATMAPHSKRVQCKHLDQVSEYNAHTPIAAFTFS
jgi:hypothetical protein